MAATGNDVLYFGTYPGSNEASVVVTGQTEILATSNVEAWLMAEESVDHSVNDAAYGALLMAVTCSVPTEGEGFTIYAVSAEKLQGTFKVRWVWAD